MRYEVPHVDRNRHLINIIRDALDGDTIICHSIPMVDLGDQALKRMCPGKKLTFVLENESR